MKKNFKSGLIILIVLIVLAVCVIIASLFITPKNNNESAGAFGSDYIALIDISGTIEAENNSYNQEWLLNKIKSFKKDEKNKGIALFINSPGGAVYQADEVYLALKDYQGTGKKVYSYFGSLAASGGYYIGCAGDKVWANRNTLTGSIGVIAGQSFDMTELFENIGIKSETIHAGKNKNMMNYNEELTDEQRKIMQSVADECYEQFCGIVATERNMKIDRVYELADGRIYTANQAYINGLIDNIGSYEDMIIQLKNEVEAPNAKVVSYKYEGKKSFVDQLIGKVTSAENSATAAKIGIPEKVLKDMNNSTIYPAYLYK